jgi:hypothetical protein
MNQETLPIIASGEHRSAPSLEERRKIADDLRRKYSGQLAGAPRWKVILIEIRIALDAWCLDLHRLYRSAHKSELPSKNERSS